LGAVTAGTVNILWNVVQRRVLGIDLSEKMIHEANEKNADPKIIYRVCGLDDYDYPADSYDCVISNLVLHYIADIDLILKKIYLTLKTDGIFLLNMEHPVFTAGVNQDWIYDSGGKPLYWPVDDYFYSGERVTHFLGKTVTKQHHTLTQILMGLIDTGFRLEVVEEAMPSADMMDIPDMPDEMRRPMMLLIKALKQGAR
jgi:ubiquinone/menaquinone biosynthesis C-methylase UbiE